MSNVVDYRSKKTEKALTNPTVSKMLEMWENKDEVIKNQERLDLKSIQSLQRFRELYDKLYTDEYLKLFTLNGNDVTNYETVIKICDKSNIHTKLLEAINEIIGGEFYVEVEKTIYPTSLSFNGNGRKHILVNYDGAIVEIK